jgi:hypothetical protein
MGGVVASDRACAAALLAEYVPAHTMGNGVAVSVPTTVAACSWDDEPSFRVLPANHPSGHNIGQHSLRLIIKLELGTLENSLGTLGTNENFTNQN